MHSESEKALSKLLPFLVNKVFQIVIGSNFKAKKMSTGDLLIEIEMMKQSEALLALNMVSEYKVSVTPHCSLNSIRGVLSEDDLLDVSEEEIMEGLSSQGVIDVSRIKLRREGIEKPTKHVILTFNATTLPDSVKAGYLNCNVRPYIPNPRRCLQCQRFGHSSQTCRGKPTCGRCGGATPHLSDPCAATFHCINCGGSHAAYSRACPSWKREKDIITLKIKENISYPEAR